MRAAISLADVIGIHERIGAFLGRIATFVFAEPRVAFVIVGVGQRRHAPIRAIRGNRAFVNAGLERRACQSDAFIIGVHVGIVAFLRRIAAFVFAYAACTSPIVTIQQGRRKVTRAIDGAGAFLITRVDR